MKKILVFVCIGALGFSQDTIKISLPELETINLENNLNLKIALAEYELTKAFFYESLTQGLPKIGFSINQNQTEGVVQNATGDFLNDITKNSSWQGNFYKVEWNVADLIFESVVKHKKKKICSCSKRINRN